MKKLIMAAAFVAATAFAAPAALAQQVSVLIVDMNKVVSQSAAYRAARPQLESRGQSIESARTNYENQFKAEDQTLQQQAQSGVAAPEVLRQKGQELQQKMVAANQDLQRQAAQLSRTEQWVVKQIIDGATPIVQAIMREKSASVVLNEAATFAYTQGLDITNDVVARLNQSVPTVSLTPPANN